MVTHARIDYRPNPLWQGSRNRRGDQVDREFDAALLDLLGDVRLLLRFDNSGATLTDRSKNARTLTWSEDVSAFDTPPVELGSGYAVTFNGTDEEGDTPDSDELSFGDGAVDQPFSIVALVNPSDATDSTILSKLNVNIGGGEWRFFLDGSDHPHLELQDQSTDKHLGRSDATALAQNTWSLLVATYNGTGAEPGIRIYLNGVRVDDTSNTSAGYVAMENGTQAVGLGFNPAGALSHYFDGAMALVALTAKCLLPQEAWALKEHCDGYFGLSL